MKAEWTLCFLRLLHACLPAVFWRLSRNVGVRVLCHSCRVCLKREDADACRVHPAQWLFPPDTPVLADVRRRLDPAEPHLPHLHHVRSLWRLSKEFQRLARLHGLDFCLLSQGQRRCRGAHRQSAGPGQVRTSGKLAASGRK